jgi:hypothetical protein
VEGLTVISSRPKLGKTTLLRQKAIAIATGGEFLGERCKQADVLFFSLEEGKRLMRRKLLRAGYAEADLARVTFAWRWKRGAEGVRALAGYLDEHPEVLYVVIDSLTRFRPLPGARLTQFDADYNAFDLLHQLTNARPGLCIDVIHHSRKMRGEDPLDDISGTLGLSAAIDAYCVLRPDGDDMAMHVGGRLWDRDEHAYTLARAPGERWALMGERTGHSPEQLETLTAVRAAPDGLTAQTHGEQLGISRQAAWLRLRLLAERGEIAWRKGAFYAVSQ